jgi:hypothetical protein
VRIEQAVDATTLELERLGEEQPFVTKVLGERSSTTSLSP